MSSLTQIGAEERRHKPRRKLNEIIYISLRQGNGGIVLDVSEDGLGFHTVRPVELGETLAFRFSVAPLAGMEVLGKLAWRDATGKSGGLQFAELPGALHDQLLLWLGCSSDSPPRTATIQVRAEVKEKLPTERKTLETVPERKKPLLVAARVTRRTADLRTKLFVYAAIVAIAIGGSMTMRVSRFVKSQAEQQLTEKNAQSALASRALVDQVALGLERKADLLSTMAAMTPANDSAMQNLMENPLINDGSDLMAWADGMNQVSALHTTDGSMTAATAEAMLIGSLRAQKPTDWWVADGKLYQVVLSSVHHEPLGYDRSGTIVVGRRMDSNQLRDLADILGSQLAFSYAGKIVASSLNSYEEDELSQRLQNQSTAATLQIGKSRFEATSINLTDDARPAVALLILKSRDETDASQNRQARLLRQLTEAEFLMLAVLVLFAVFVLRPTGANPILR